MFNTKELNKFRKTLNQRKTNPYSIATKIALHSSESNLPLNANNTTIANLISKFGYVPTPNVIRSLREYKPRVTANNIQMATNNSVALEEEVEEVKPMSSTIIPANPVRQLTKLPHNKLGVVASNQPVAISMQKYNIGSANADSRLRLEQFGFGTKDNPHLYSQEPVVAANESSA